MAGINADMRLMIKAAEKAGRSLARDFGEVENLQVSKKGPGDFVSAADIRAEEIIVDELKFGRPDHGFLLEEGGEVKGKNEYRFIVDPLDGTSNFLHGLPHWAVSIGLERNGEIIAGVVHDPIKGELFHATKGEGAFSGRNRLRVSGRKELMSAMIGTGSPRRAVEKRDLFAREYKAVMNVAPGLRRYGAAALDLAYVAAGRFDAFWERDLKSWDVAAGILIVREAGGMVHDLNDRRNNPVVTGSVLAANPDLHPQLEKVLKAA